MPVRVLVAVVVIAFAFVVTVQGGANQPGGRFVPELTEAVRQLSFASYEGTLYKIRPNGGRKGPADASAVAPLRSLRGAVLWVHGSQYNPGRVGMANPFSTFAHVVRSHLDRELTAVSFGWDSVPFGVKSQFAALCRGRLTVYSLARRNLDPSVPPLVALIEALPETWSAVCHSLGCELLRHTLERHPQLFTPRRILMLSGDLREASLDRLAASKRIEVLAVRSLNDRPLGRSAFRGESRAFWTGAAKRTAAWADLMFYPGLLEQGGRWSFRYKNRRRYWDHMATFEFSEPGPPITAFLSAGRR